MGEKKSFIEKVKEHKTEIFIAGVTIITIAGVIIISKKRSLAKNHNASNLLKVGTKLKDEIIWWLTLSRQFFDHI